MDSGRFIFDGSSSCHGNMLFLGKRDHVFQGQRSSVMGIEESSKRGFFFGSSDDLYDDEFYDEQSPEKKRRLTSEQVLLLEKSFETENKLEPDRKTQLAKKLGLQPRQVAVWFQNRRARWKTKQLERDYDLLKSSYDSLLSDYDSIIKENEKLKTEVVSLTEKLQAKEVTGMAVVGQKSDHPQLSFANAASTDVLAIQFNVKTEDPLSSGTGGSSSVVDEDGPQLVDSGDSYFPNDDVYNGYMSHVDGVQSEEDDGSDDNRSCYWAVAAAEHQQQEQQETEPLSWWIWP